MTALDDLVSKAEAAGTELAEAESLTNDALQAAQELEAGALGHGWPGVATAMATAQEIMEEASSGITDAARSVSAGNLRAGSRSPLLIDLLDRAREHLTSAQEVLDSAAEDAASERSTAEEWGHGNQGTDGTGEPRSAG